LALATADVSPRARAQDEVSAPVTPNVGAPDAPPVIKAPKLRQFAEPTFPPDALAQGLSGRVEVELVVEVDGHTRDPKIKTPAGHGFDEAALEAASRLLFEPATRNGTAIPARIVFPYIFEFKAPEPPPEAEPPPPALARIDGRVVEQGNGQALAGVEVLLSGQSPETLAQPQRAVTASDGRFSFAELPAGTYRVSLSKAQFSSQESDETLAAGEVADFVYRMQTAPDTEAFHATARVAPPPREVTRRTITKEELTRIPGTRGDALRTVELLPGVARPPFGSGAIIVRGSSPQDTQVLLDGVPVALLYHFGGLTSFINSRMLESVDFYPGNFSVRYGRRRGGIVEASLADPARDKLHGVLDLNLIDGSIFLQGPITSNWEFAAAARRSWIDVTLGAALSSADNISSVAAPVYYDYQVMTTYRPSDRDKLRIVVYGSGDNFKLLFEQPSDDDPAVSGNFKLATQFHRIHATWQHKISNRVDQDIELALGVFDSEFGLGESFNFSLKGEEAYLRSEWRMRVTDKVRLISGIDAAVLPAKVSYGGPPLGQQEGNADNGGAGATLSNRSKIATSEKLTAVQPALYLESDLDLDPFHIVLGSRIDYDNATEQFSFDPRLAVHVALTEQTRLKGGIGLFSQPPQYQESSRSLGNPNLRPTHTLHTGLGIDHTLMPGVKLGVEGFYKYLYDAVIGTTNGMAPLFINGGKGRIYGLEVSAKVDPKGRFFGYLSYTLSRSERNDHNDGYRLFDYDQPHILTLSGVYRLGRGWEAGLTFRLVAGNPATPVVGGIFNKDTALFSPLQGALNSIRNPYFHRLDMRIEKLWTFQAWRFALYLDIQNVYNAANREGLAYDFQYQQSAAVRGLPILPSLGVRGEL
jgi:TonB family protein